MEKLFEILLLYKISNCMLIFLEKKHFIFGKFIKSFVDVFKDFKLASRPVLPSVLKLELSGMFGKPPAFYSQTLAFFNIKKLQLEKNLKNSCEKKVFKNITT